MTDISQNAQNTHNAARQSARVSHKTARQPACVSHNAARQPACVSHNTVRRSTHVSHNTARQSARVSRHAALALAGLLLFSGTGISTVHVYADDPATAAAVSSQATESGQDSKTAQDTNKPLTAESTQNSKTTQDTNKPLTAESAKKTPVRNAQTNERQNVTTSGSAVQTASAGLDMYRMYNAGLKEHFYTSSTDERTALLKAGWVYEGVAWTVPATSSVPVYRLYNPQTKIHHYTTSASERDSLAAGSWKYEGIGWYSDPAKQVPIYRQYNPRTGAHNYTASKTENDALAKKGWTAEGIAFYGIPHTEQTVTSPITWYNGVDLSAVYDYYYYRDHNPDVVAKLGTQDNVLIRHFATHGMKEGRSGKEIYDQKTYDALNKEINNPDVYTIKGVPQILQNPELPTGCESVSLTICLRYLGYNIPKTEIATSYLSYGTNYADSFVGDPFTREGAGIYPPGICAAANRFLSEHKDSRRCHDLTGASMEDLYRQVQQNRPVMVWTTEYMAKPNIVAYQSYNGRAYPWYQEEHCVVLFGYNRKAGTVQISDPLAGIVTRKASDFTSIYNSIGKFAAAIY